jgi:hypothetical protein
MDPALATISDFFDRAWRGWWLYFVAPFLAMATAAFLFYRTSVSQKVLRRTPLSPRKFTAKVFAFLRSDSP